MKTQNRRNTLKTLGSIAATTVFPSPSLAVASSVRKPIRFGVIADLHGGLAVDAMSRLEAFVGAMQHEDCDGLIQMGDFAYPNDRHQSFADKFHQAHTQTIYVIGNHEFDHGLTRKDCCRAWGIDASYYRRDVGGLRLLILDGNEKGSPTHRGGYPSFIGRKQQQWLERELDEATSPVLILSHQPLAGTSAIDNAAELQKLLSAYRSKIVACLNGHSHVDLLLQVAGVHYLHINSASYYWVGGRTRMAYYTTPLFTTVTVDPESATVSVAPCASDWKGKSPREIGYFDSTGRPPESAVTPQIRRREIAAN
ncbi:MAG: metallophosphoesterase [Planctomycetaceae bacterium]|nr:metallophosphoesterase [Planctomycetaceae bacterium]